MAPINEKIATLRLRLRQKDNAADFGDIIGEIRKLGPDGAVLIPDLIKRIESGTYPTTMALVPLIVLHKNGELLEVATKVWEQTGPGLNPRDKAALFAAGFHQFQEELIEYLRDSFDQDGDPFRVPIVDAFAASGTASLFEDLEAIAILCERRLKELKRSNRNLSMMEQIDRKGYTDLREEFLNRLQKAIERVRLRPDLPPLEKSKLSIDAQDTPPPESPQSLPADSIITESPSEWAHLHPEVLRHAGSLLAIGNYFHAVSESAKAFDKAVAKAAGSSERGTSLMFQAFGKKGKLRVSPGDSDTDENIQEGTMHLASGLMRAVRNPTAHEPALDWPLSRQDTMDILGLISFLYRQLDKATEEPTDPTEGGELK